MKQNNLNWIKNVEYGACGFIGSAFVTTGLFYVMPRNEYYVPPILMPLFDLFGNIGFAVGLLLLGVSLILYALNRWRKYVAETGTFVVLIAFSMALLISINILSDNTIEYSQQHFTAEADMQHEEQPQKLEDMERPEFSNTEVTLFFLSFESLLERYRDHLKTNDDQALDRDYEGYNELVQRVPDLLATLSSDERFRFAQYYAKLQIEWSDTTR